MIAGQHLAGHDLDVHAPLAAALAQQCLLLRLGLLDGSLPAAAGHSCKSEQPKGQLCLKAEQMACSEQPSVHLSRRRTAVPLS